MMHNCSWIYNKKYIPLVCILGIAVTGASNVATDLVSSNRINDYSFIIQPVMRDVYDVILRCASGLGPPGNDQSTVLGGWYFDGAQILVRKSCMDAEFEVRAANARLYPGVINLYQCGTFTATEEGVYSCIMMNSSMVEQTMRVGVYFSGRSESLDVYPITSLLTIFYLST